MGLTLAQKIIKSHIVSGELIVGNEIGLKIDQTLTQDATGTMAYLAENGTVENQVITGTEGLALNTDIGMKAYSKSGTGVSVNKANTNVINNGIITMKNNSAGSTGLST